MILFVPWVLGNTAWHARHGTLPGAEVMGVVGIAALIAGWPDVIVAAIMGGLGLGGHWQIVSQARGALRGELLRQAVMIAGG